MAWVCLIIERPSKNHKVGGSGEHKVARQSRCQSGGFPSPWSTMAVQNVVTESLAQLSASTDSNYLLFFIKLPLP
jgi:hypothetical protein